MAIAAALALSGYRPVPPSAVCSTASVAGALTVADVRPLMRIVVAGSRPVTAEAIC